MFKNSKKAKIDPNSTDTLIGEGSAFEGRIKSEAGLRVEGQIVGDIECEGDVTVGENGIARSNVKARNVIIAGQVTGNVSASGKLTIKATGKLHGNLAALELSIESGGIFHGQSKMDVKDVPAPAPAAEEKAQSWESTETKHAAAAAESAASVLKTW
ncbi:polymer-forming cytoskeletal protein [Cohnella sp. GCM10027633]|uniref:bactofilin family protein n=1 Tax=unclassified Cohnella TaxID=2636738 RepID=UPI00362B53E4